MDHIVVWDPEEKYWEGSLVDHPTGLQVKGRGGVVLPVDPSLFQVSGVGGYMKRAWGAGWPCDHQTPRHFCPLTLYLTKNHRMVHWAARLVPDSRFIDAERSGPPDSPGQIQLMAMSPRANTYQAPLTPRVQAKVLRELGPADSEKGWTIGGAAIANVAFDGLHSFALYGMGSGVRVAWAALTAVQV